MQTVNVIIAVEAAVAAALRDNFKLIDPEQPELGTVRNDLTIAEKRKLRNAFGGGHKSVTVAGTTYVILDFYFPGIPVSKEDPTLLWLERFKQRLPGQEFVVGAWNPDGTMYGTTLVPATYDSEGVELTPETVTGSPVYPVHDRVMDIMPDDVIYDAAGQEVSRQPATALKQVHKLLGWADRRWT